MGAQLDMCLEPILAGETSEEANLDELVKAASAGDRAAFAQVVDQQYEFVLRVAHKWLGNQQDAEDVTQTVVIKLAQAIGQFDCRSKFSSWLYRITLKLYAITNELLVGRGATWRH